MAWLWNRLSLASCAGKIATMATRDGPRRGGEGGSGRDYPGKELEAMSFAHNYHRWIIDEFAQYLGAAVAEVGAGRGDVSNLLRKCRVERLLAFEPSEQLFGELQR